MAKDWIQKYKKVDRYQHMYTMDYNYDDIYEFYRENYSKKISKKEFKKLCYTFNKIIGNKIIKESFEFKLPFRLGSIRIKAEKQKIKFKENGKVDKSKTSIDWGATWKMWYEQFPHLSYKEIQAEPNKTSLVHTNEHSNGYIMRWFWDKRLSNTKNQSAYIFKPVKGGYLEKEGIYYGKRGLSSWIKNYEKTNEYYE